MRDFIGIYVDGKECNACFLVDGLMAAQKSNGRGSVYHPSPISPSPSMTMLEALA
jgi:hypothetical protein